jgi:hypothetical protein
MSSRRRPPLRVEVVPAESLVIGPEDRLILRIPEGAWAAEDAETMMADLAQTLREVGLGERTLVLLGDVEMGKVEA